MIIFYYILWTCEICAFLKAEYTDWTKIFMLEYGKCLECSNYWRFSLYQNENGRIYV